MEAEAARECGRQQPVDLEVASLRQQLAESEAARNETCVQLERYKDGRTAADEEHLQAACQDAVVRITAEHHEVEQLRLKALVEEHAAGTYRAVAGKALRGMGAAGGRGRGKSHAAAAARFGSFSMLADEDSGSEEGSEYEVKPAAAATDSDIIACDAQEMCSVSHFAGGGDRSALPGVKTAPPAGEHEREQGSEYKEKPATNAAQAALSHETRDDARDDAREHGRHTKAPHDDARDNAREATVRQTKASHDSRDDACEHGRHTKASHGTPSPAHAREHGRQTKASLTVRPSASSTHVSQECGEELWKPRVGERCKAASACAVLALRRIAIPAVRAAAGLAESVLAMLIVLSAVGATCGSALVKDALAGAAELASSSWSGAAVFVSACLVAAGCTPALRSAAALRAACVSLPSVALGRSMWAVYQLLWLAGSALGWLLHALREKRVTVLVACGVVHAAMGWQPMLEAARVSATEAAVWQPPCLSNGTPTGLPRVSDFTLSVEPTAVTRAAVTVEPMLNVLAEMPLHMYEEARAALHPVPRDERLACADGEVE